MVEEENTVYCELGKLNIPKEQLGALDGKQDIKDGELHRKYGVCKNCQRQWGQILPVKEPLNITVLNNTVKSCEDAFSD